MVAHDSVKGHGTSWLELSRDTDEYRGKGMECGYKREKMKDHKPVRKLATAKGMAMLVAFMSYPSLKHGISRNPGLLYKATY